MDRFDREILDFMRSWAPYGGPPADEVLEEFGMTRDELVDRMSPHRRDRGGPARARAAPTLAAGADHCTRTGYQATQKCPHEGL